MKFGVNDVLTFGKYKGDRLSYVLWKEPQYIEWCLSNIPWFEITKPAKRRLEDQLEGHYEVLEEVYRDELGLSWTDFQ